MLNQTPPTSEIDPFHQLFLDAIHVLMKEMKIHESDISPAELFLLLECRLWVSTDFLNVKNLSSRLLLAGTSVADRLRYLRQLGYIEYNVYRNISVTEEGGVFLRGLMDALRKKLETQLTETDDRRLEILRDALDCFIRSRLRITFEQLAAFLWVAMKGDNSSRGWIRRGADHFGVTPQGFGQAMGVLSHPKWALIHRELRNETGSNGVLADKGQKLLKALPRKGT